MNLVKKMFPQPFSQFPEAYLEGGGKIITYSADTEATSTANRFEGPASTADCGGSLGAL
jgi:hypothetical protein